MKPARYIAFLRAVNVGGRTVKMDQLRRLFESMGYSEVQTFIASGNVVFESSVNKAVMLERAIEAMLEERLGFTVAAMVRTTREVAEAAKQTPFAAETDGGTVYVAFLRTAPAKDAARTLESLSNAANAYRVKGREVYWLIRGASFADASKSAANIEKVLGTPATVRNTTTVRKMAAKFCAAYARP